MTIINTEDWLHVLENTDYEPAENTTTVYQSYRFADLKTEDVTVDNFRAQIGDSIVITKDGYEIITHHPKKITEVII